MDNVNNSNQQQTTFNICSDDVRTFKMDESSATMYTQTVEWSIRSERERQIQK